MLVKSKEPFWFKTQLSLVMLTGLKARNLLQLRDYLKDVPESSVYYHTHHFLQQHQFLTPEPPNDFAYWVGSILQEDEIGERLAAIDTVRFTSLAELREAIVRCIDEYLSQGRVLREAPPGDEFHFKRCILFVLPSAYRAGNLQEFLECLKKVSIHCLYNHIFAGRLRDPRGIDDFSFWLETQLDEPKLAKQLQRLDPYTHTLDDLRKTIIRLAEWRLKELNSAETG